MVIVLGFVSGISDCIETRVKRQTSMDSDTSLKDMGGERNDDETKREKVEKKVVGFGRVNKDGLLGPNKNLFWLRINT
jgi:hypothetical protein